MRLCSWAGAWHLLLVLVLLYVFHVKASEHEPRERHYYIAAVEIDWKYSGNDIDRFSPIYKKVVFREYEKDFKQAKTHPAWLGLLGPTLRAEEGETIVVTFRNMATEPYSIHPHGVAYGKQSEGANYFDNTSQKEKEDDVVQPNREHVYSWEVTSNVSPQPNDPTCLTYSYISHQNVVRDYNSGLIGTLLVCKPGSLDVSGKQIGVHNEYVLLFGVFDEKESKYSPKSHSSDDHVKYTINGYTMGSLPDVSLCAYAPVSLQLLGMSSEPEVFSVHINGQVLQQTGHKVSSVGLISGSSTTASMVALHTGRWLLSSHTIKHMEAGMHGFVDVKECDGFQAPRRRLSIAQKRQTTEWTYHIAAEEIVWDYAPNMPEHIDENFKSKYLWQSSTRIGGKYKKAVYTLYKDESFTEKLETKQRKNELGILGPVIRAQIRDVIKIVFKNKASRPYSIYPHGLSIEKSEEGVNYPAGGNQSHGVQPGETHTYEWKVLEEDTPLEKDSRCLTRMYHSAVDTPRDIASGLIGPMLICKSQSLNVRNVQLRADKEQHAMFAVFDENKSWYLDDNIRQYCDRSKVNKADPDFHKSNVMHTINGYVFESGPILGFCNGEVATWHVSSIGAQEYIQTATFYGHTFELNDRKEDILSLYPMTGETITMNMDNFGVWLLASLNSHETTKGVRVMFQDVECYRDHVYEYTEEEGLESNIEFNEWRPQSFDEYNKKEATPKPPKNIVAEEDDLTAMYAQELGLRSLGNQSGISDVDKLDLSFLNNYDDIDVLNGDSNITLYFTEKKSENETSIPKENVINATLLQNWKELDRQNLTEVNLKKEATPEPPKNIVADKGDLTAMYAQELGLRSLGNQSGISDVEKLDLSFLNNYDDIDVLNGDSNITLYFTEKKSENETSIPKENVINATLLQNWKELDRQNFTEVNLKKEATPEPPKNIVADKGDLTAMYAQELGLRSLGNQSGISDVEKLDLSFLNNYDDIDVLNGDSNITLYFTEKISENETSIPKENVINATLLPKWKELDRQNLTEVNLLNQSISENTTHMQNRSRQSSSMYKTENTTVVHSLNVSLNNNSITTNSSTSVVSDLDNVTVTDTKNIMVHNASALLVAQNVSAEIINVTVDNLTSILETERMTRTLTGDNQTSVDIILVEDSEERLTRGDVFSPPDLSANNLNSTLKSNVTLLSRNTTEENKNNTVANHVNMSADGLNHLLSIPSTDVVEGDISKIVGHTLTFFEVDVESTGKKTSDNNSLITATEPEYGLQMNSSENVTLPANSSLENVTYILFEAGPFQNVTMNISISNSSDGISSESRENITAPLAESNHTFSVDSFSNETMVSGNLSVSGNAASKSSSEMLSGSESSEEVLIYIKGNNTNLIKTTAVKTQGHNWTYEGTHQMVPMEIPDYMIKYFGKETPPTTPTPKKIRKVNLRQRPQKGHGMKTKRRKEYKPQARSGLPSPRGFNPFMTPRGARPNIPRPVSDEEDLINIPVVIGVPRPDFSNYELYIPGDEPEHLGLDEQDVKADEYEYVVYKDPYSSHEDIKNAYLDETTKYFLQQTSTSVKMYFIAAEEVEWDYAGYGQKRQEKSQLNSRETKFTKVVFRSYLDSSFNRPEVRGEIDEHLGILGPVIKAEVDQTIMVVFKNNAKRPYSLHPNGVSYSKQAEGLNYEDRSKYWHKYDNEVQPGRNYTYLWKVNSMVGPTQEESHCRTWAYYSGVNPERDIHSGLIGPLLVCRKGTLNGELPDMRQFMLLFMTFDESQSWYFDKNYEMMQRKNRRRVMDPKLKENLKFHSINGIIHNLKGLRMYTNQLVCWHLINMGSPKDLQSVHFHGQTFLHKKTTSYRQAVHPLLPGSFATLEMYPSKPGLWQLETEVGFNQQKGMQTLFLVLDNDCYRPLGLQSGSVKDEQITAINTRGYWEPYLARLNNQGKYNAWSTEQNSSWIQVDFQRPVVISQVATQGARQLFQTQFVEKYTISYSTDRRKWTFYKGDSNDFRKVFSGNKEAHDIKKNTFFPPLIGRFIRLHPISWSNKATVRMEFYGCELDGCSVPLGMESGLIEDHRITASSTASSWYSGPWRASLARLNKQGTVNAWQAQQNDMNQWLQVELQRVKKITGIITQGAKSLGNKMYVVSYTLQYSNNGRHWKPYSDDEDVTSKTFFGNTDNNDHVKNYIYPPIFTRFIRIIPTSWMSSITMRIELLGCEFE